MQSRPHEANQQVLPKPYNISGFAQDFARRGPQHPMINIQLASLRPQALTSRISKSCPNASPAGNSLALVTPLINKVLHGDAEEPQHYTPPKKEKQDDSLQSPRFVTFTASQWSDIHATTWERDTSRGLYTPSRSNPLNALTYL